ncbi:hypothetical protein FQZ97_877770 [compost metagenome]
MEHHARWRRSVPTAVVAQHGPEITGLRFAASRIQHRSRGLIDVEPRTFRHQPFGHVVNHRRDRSTRPTHPICQDRAVDRHSVSGHDCRLAVQRHVFRMLRHGNLRQQGFGRPAAFQQMCRRPGLNHARATLGAGVFWADRDNHLVARRNLIEPFRPIFADPNHVAATTGAGDAVGLDHPLDPRQALRQRACPTLLARNSLCGINCAGRDLFLDEGDLGLRFGNRRLQVLQRQFHLRRIELFRFRPKLRAPIVLNLALQLLDQLLQLADEGVLFGHHRLLMLACRTLDRQLELHRRKGFQYLGRKVRELAKIDRLRHACS